MSALLLPFGAAAGLTVAVLLLLLRHGQRLPMDVANDRSLHAGAVPRTGGIAVALAAAGSLLLCAPAGLPVAIAGPAAGLFALSLADDWRSLPVVPRLLGHLLAAAATVWGLGLPWPAALLVVPLLVWMTNLYNFMDGADGLAGGMAVIGFATYALAAWPQAPGLAAAGLAIAGAAAGFLVFNFPPARVFLGDAGSVPLGFLAGSLGLAGWQAGLWAPWFPVLVFLPFIADATLTLLRRAIRGERVWQAHREHIYQRLALAGWAGRRLTLSAWLIMLACASVAIWLQAGQ